MLLLQQSDQFLSSEIALSSSKSESNRALLIRALSKERIVLNNLSDARDTQTMQFLLSEQTTIWDVKDAGTTMRFCTAYLGIHGKGEIITGTPRMQERPIGILVDALRKLGSEIHYQVKEGYPPIKVNKITKQGTKSLEIPGNISSQYISALLMIGPTLPDGLELILTTDVFSRPYIEMTLSLMHHFGINYQWVENRISMAPQEYHSGELTIESDWSGASYWYSLVAMNPGLRLKLLGLKEKSTQGDQEIVNIMKQMGVVTFYESDGISIATGGNAEHELNIDFKTCPDLAQTVMVTATALGIRLNMTGLESLKIKETDRIYAMKSELEKIGANLIEVDDHWILELGKLSAKSVAIKTYEDHRMAMSFAPLCSKMDIEIDDPTVVQKSYPGFWEDLKRVGVKMT